MNRSHRRSATAALVAALALGLLAGCGGDDKDTEDPAGSTTTVPGSGDGVPDGGSG